MMRPTLEEEDLLHFRGGWGSSKDSRLRHPWQFFEMLLSCMAFRRRETSKAHEAAQEQAAAVDQPSTQRGGSSSEKQSSAGSSPSVC